MSSSSSSGGGAVEPIGPISSGWNYLGVVRIGDNAVTGNVWEFCVGADTQGNCSTGERVWDSNISDGVNSDWVSVVLKVALAGATGSVGDFTVDGSNINYAQGPYSHITKVQLQAVVDGISGQMQFQEISAVFRRDDGTSETVAVDPTLAPDAHISSGSGTVKQAIQINPSSNNFVIVEISAQVKMSSTNTTLPSADALSAGIYVFTA